MSLDTELERFFSEQPAAVVRDPDRFRGKLNIGAAAFKYLNGAQNLGNFMTALSTGFGVASMSYFGWTASLGVIGQLGLALGFVSTPAGWVAAAGVGGMASVLMTRRLFRSVRKEAVTEVPNFINTPLDALGASVSDTICPVLLKIAHADGALSSLEVDKIKCYFVDEWGMDPAYVEGLLNYDLEHIEEFEWEDVKSALEEVGKTGDIDYETMAGEIVTIAKEVMASDGVVHPSEQREVDALGDALKKEDIFNAVKQRIRLK